MAISANNPRLSNQIKSDVPEIQQKEAALLKMDPTNVADLEVGSKRLIEISSGNWQFQTWNGSQWVNVGKLKMDVDTVDGYDASITPKANTVAVRSSDGKLQDSITGNAATADTAVSLSQTLVVGKGGTGATTSEQARANLGVPPTSHASANTTYGLSSESEYGHAKASSDNPTQDTDDGAVGIKVSEFARGDHSHKKVLGNADTYGQVKLTDSVSDESAASSSVAASAKAVKTAYDKANEAATTVMTGATASSDGTSGNVPAPQAGDQNRPLTGNGKYAESIDCAASRLSGKYLDSSFQDTPDWWRSKSNSIFAINKLGVIHNQPAQYGTIINTVIGNEIQQIFIVQPQGKDFYTRGANFDGWNGNASDSGTWHKISNSMPVGAIYVQFSGQSSPSELFGGTWSNVSSSYAGRFFRAEGGSAAAFGKTQADAAPNIYAWACGIETYKTRSSSGAFTYSDPINNNVIGSGSDFGSASLNFNASYSNGKYGDASEFRPINSTIRIWKRTA